MAHNAEPMDIDNIDCDFDNKENSLYHHNVQSRTPSTEKGYEELDVSELNMKLRYSITPASSPMSKSYTASSVNNMNEESINNVIVSMTRSFNSSVAKNESISKSLKVHPLQLQASDQTLDTNRNISVLRPLDTTMTANGNKVTVTVTETNDACDNLSVPSSSSSAAHTPEATTPTKEIPKCEGSPIMRGLKTVLNMFRSSQSPIPPSESDIDSTTKHDISSPTDGAPLVTRDEKLPVALASTPIAAHRSKGTTSKSSSPHKDSIVFNDDLEKELLWKDETTILFSQEKIPINKLYYQQSKQLCDQTVVADKNKHCDELNDSINTTVEYMDISYNDSLLKNKTRTDVAEGVLFSNAESDGEFVDCETTFTKQSNLLDDGEFGDPTMKSITNIHEIPDSIDTVEKQSNILQNDTIDNVIAMTTDNKQALFNVTVPIELPDKLILDETFNKNNTQGTLTESDIVSKFESILENSKCNALSPNTDDIIIKTHTIADCFNESQDAAVSNVMSDTQSLSDHKQNMNIDIIQEFKNGAVLSQLQQYNNTLAASIKENTQVCEVKELVNSISIPDESVTVSAIAAQNVEIQMNTDIVKESSDTLSRPSCENSVLFTKDVAQNEDIQINTDRSKESFDVISKHLCENSVTLESVTEKMDMQTKFHEVKESLDGTISRLSAIPTNSDKFQEVMESGLSRHSCDDLVTSVIATDDTQVMNTTESIKESIDALLGQSFDKSLSSTTFINNITEDINDQTNTEFTTEFLNTSEVSEKFKNDFEILNKPNIASVNVNADLSATTINQLKSNCHNKDEGEANIIKSDVMNDISIEETEAHLDTTIFAESTNDLQITIFSKDLTEGIEIKNKVNCNTAEETSNELDSSLVHAQAISTQSVAEQLVLSLKELCEKKKNEKDSDISNTNIISDGDKNLELKFEGRIGKLITDTNQEKGISCNKVNKSKNEFAENDISTLIEKAEIDKSEFENNNDLSNFSQRATLPTDVPLPDEDELEKEASITFDQLSRNTSIKSVLPDVISNLNFSKLESKDVVNEAFAEKTRSKLSHETEAELKNEEIISIDQNNDTNQNKVTELLTLKNAVDDKIEEPTQVGQDTKDVIKSSEQEFLKNINIDTKIDVCSEKVSPQKKSLIDSNIVTNNESQSQLEYKAADIPNSMNLSKNNNHIEIESEVTNIIETPSRLCETKEIYQNVNELNKIESPISQGKIQEDIVVSENNSPYVFVSIDKVNDVSLDDDFEKIENSFVTKSMVSISPPMSPKIDSKRYNFNFDEIENPFATKSKIRMSPPIDTPKKSEQPKQQLNNRNKQKSYLGKNTLNAKKSIKNSSLNNTITNQTEIIANKETEEVSNNQEKSELETNKDITTFVVKAESQFEETVSVDNKSITSTTTLSSSEQSTYYSAETSSGDSIVVKNVFNLPEIDDTNFNPFVTKSKIRQSPPNSLENNNMFNTDSVSCDIAPDTNTQDSNLTVNIDSVLSSEKNNSGSTIDGDISANITCSSKATDEKDITVREIHTDDEDTIEGPFLEADDLSKEPDFVNEKDDMMQITDSPAQANDENEMFIDAEAFEFLLNQNKTNVVSDSGRESLFLRFDPLFAKRLSSDGVTAALTKKQKRQSTPKKLSKPLQMNTMTIKQHDAGEKPVTGEKPIAGPSNITQEHNVAEDTPDDFNITPSKPMMVVTPAVNPIITPRKTISSPSANRRSITFTSPAIAVIDRLLSLSANNSLVDHETTITHVNREQNEADLALTQLRELLAEKEIHVYNLRSESKELKDRLTTLESQMKVLEIESEDRLKKVNELTEKLSEKTKVNKSMAAVVEEYERTIASLIAETEQDRKRHQEERARLIKERDEQTAHLSSMEVSFSDLHSKYEKSKQVILTCKANEDTYKKSIKQFEENLAKMQNNYELLKQHATSKLNHSNQELEKMNRAHEAEVLKLNAMIKRKELHITSLEETLAQKTKANEELTAICDELINKVG